MESTLKTLCNLWMTTIIGQWTCKLISPGLTTFLLANLTELGNIWCHITHIVQSKSNHIRNVSKCATTCSVVETLLTHITIYHWHEWQTSEHSSHRTTTLLTIVVDLVIEGVKSEYRLCRCCTHLLQVGQTCPIENLLGIGLCIGKRATAITGTHWIALSIGNSKALCTHDNSFMEKAASQWTLAKCSNTSTTCTLTEDRYVIGVATKLCDILLYPLQCLYLVEDTIVARYLMWTLCRKCWVNKEAKNTKTIIDTYEHHILSAPLLTIELWFRPETLTIATTMNPKGNRKFLIYLSRSLRIYIKI